MRTTNDTNDTDINSAWNCADEGTAKGKAAAKFHEGLRDQRLIFFFEIFVLFVV